MVKQILSNLYLVEVPLPGSPLKALNSYVIKGEKRNLIIDTGMNHEECSRAMLAALNELGVNLWETDFFITHLHVDHLGLISQLATAGSVIYFSQPDAEVIKSSDLRGYMDHIAEISGFPIGELQELFEKHPGFQYAASGQLNFSIVSEGESLRVGDFRFEYVHTPGHTPGHMCLYEPDKKFLVAGDHILNGISPNILPYPGDRNPLEEYIASLDKVSRLEIELVLPGHRDIFRDCAKRVDELKQHHRVRAQEILSILERGRFDAFQVASQMHWDIAYSSWDLFPSTQKWFAAGEALVHLEYLEQRGIIQGKMLESRRLFYR